MTNVTQKTKKCNTNVNDNVDSLNILFFEEFLRVWYKEKISRSRKKEILRILAVKETSYSRLEREMNKNHTITRGAIEKHLSYLYKYDLIEFTYSYSRRGRIKNFILTDLGMYFKLNESLLMGKENDI